MSIRASFIDEAQEAATAFLEAIGRRLDAAGLPAYFDPPRPPDVYINNQFGRSELDHYSAPSFVRLAELGVNTSGARHLALVAANPYRLAYLPIAFAEPIETDYQEQIGGDSVSIWVGSAVRLMAELQVVASALGIQLQSGVLIDAVAGRINTLEPLFGGDSGQFAEDQRAAWLLLYEGARLSLAHNVALSLAG